MIRLLEAETRDLLSRQEHLDPEQAEWLRKAAESASGRLRYADVATSAHDRTGSS